MRNGKWGEELPWELWELILGNLGAVDRLSCVTSAKVIMERYEKGSELATLRERLGRRCGRFGRSITSSAWKRQ